jgi:hypothetical protein
MRCRPGQRATTAALPSHRRREALFCPWPELTTGASAAFACPTTLDAHASGAGALTPQRGHGGGAQGSSPRTKTGVRRCSARTPARRSLRCSSRSTSFGLALLEAWASRPVRRCNGMPVAEADGDGQGNEPAQADEQWPDFVELGGQPPSSRTREPP